MRCSHGALYNSIQYSKCLCGTARDLAVDWSPPCWLFIYHHSTIIATNVYFSISRCSMLQPTGKSIGRSIGQTLVARRSTELVRWVLFFLLLSAWRLGARIQHTCCSLVNSHRIGNSFETRRTSQDAASAATLIFRCIRIVVKNREI